MGDTKVPEVPEEDKPLYYAEHGKVWKRPIYTKTETGTTISIGFPVCTMHEAVGDAAAETVCALMNAGHNCGPDEFARLSAAAQTLPAVMAEREEEYLRAENLKKALLEVCDERDALQSRVEKLEAALQEIEEFTSDAPDDDPLSHVCGTARALLSGEPK